MGWEGQGSPYCESSDPITHQVVSSTVVYMYLVVRVYSLLDNSFVTVDFLIFLPFYIGRQTTVQTANC